MAGEPFVVNSLIKSSLAKGGLKLIVAEFARIQGCSEFLRIQLRNGEDNNFQSLHRGNVTASPDFAEIRQASQISTAARPSAPPTHGGRCSRMLSMNS